MKHEASGQKSGLEKFERYNRWLLEAIFQRLFWDLAIDLKMQNLLKHLKEMADVF